MSNFIAELKPQSISNKRMIGYDEHKMEKLSGYAKLLASVRVQKEASKPFFGKPYLKYGQCYALWSYFFQLGGILGGRHSANLDALWVRASRLIAAMLFSAAFSVSCSRHPSASGGAGTALPAGEQVKESKALQEAEQAATYELIRLRSAYQARATAADFSGRVGNAQVNINSGMTHVSDAEFRNIATRAVAAYAKVRENWELRIDFEEKATKHPNFYAQNNQDADYYKSMEALYIVRAYDLTKLAESYVNAKTVADRAQLLKNAVEADKIFENQWEKKSKAREKVLADRKRAQEESDAEWKRENDERTRTSNEEMAKQAEQAEVERKRRFAPEGTAYNLKPVKLASGKQTVIASAESTLNVVRKNADGSVHVELNGAEADVPADDLTNDRDWLAAYRSLHRDDN